MEYGKTCFPGRMATLCKFFTVIDVKLFEGVMPWLPESHTYIHRIFSQYNSIFLGRSASGPIGPPLFHFYTYIVNSSLVSGLSKE
jgi:hypothetical protein